MALLFRVPLFCRAGAAASWVRQLLRAPDRMSRQLIDPNLLTWEAYPSSGPFGFPEKPKVVFNCLSDPDLRARVVSVDGDSADAERRLQEMTTGDLQALFERTSELR